jgi:asparagine synthase (glutamine-hydrolysing)
MCGICGIIDRTGKPVSEYAISRLNGSIAHRGPDDAGIHIEDGVGLGNRRLAILDLSPRGHMPMHNDDQSMWITYNGEVYNYREIRAELESKGIRFRSECDSEVVLRAYEAWGDDCVERFHGMFAFAVWDAKRRRLFAARDRLGVKPFFYIDDGERFAFCSELKGLYELQPPSFEQLDPLSLDFFLGFGYLPPDRALIEGVQKLPPAHFLVLDAEGIHLSRYWKIEMRASNTGSLEENLEELDVVLRSAVDKRLRSDVPLGCFLSGGIDSGLVTALAAQASDEPINTFSVGFKDAHPEDDERPLARIVAERFGTRHEEFEVAPASYDLLPEITQHIGEPFADIGVLPMYQISKAARQHIAVSLSGDGGDESFVGYPNITSAVAAENVRSWLPQPITQAIETATGIPALRRVLPRGAQAHRFLRQYVNGGVVGQFDASNSWSESWRTRLYTHRQVSRRGDSRAAILIAAITDRQPDLRWPDQNLVVDLHFRLGGGYLTKVDIASNMVSLEVRSPFMDHGVVEFAAGLPLERKLLGGKQKGLLREYAKRVLPEEIVNQPKRGFAPGLDGWLRGPWSQLVRGLAERSVFVEREIFDGAVVRKVTEDHLSGRELHGQRIWNLVCLESWAQLFLS